MYIIIELIYCQLVLTIVIYTLLYCRMPLNNNFPYIIITWFISDDENGDDDDDDEGDDRHCKKSLV
jgi:hypothetical protein